MFKPHEPGENSRARCRTSQGLRPRLTPPIAPYLVLCCQCSAGLPEQSTGLQRCLYVGDRGPNRGPPRPSLHQALNSGPHLHPSQHARKAPVIDRAPIAPVGARESESPSGHSGRGAGKAQGGGVPSRRTHQEPTAKEKGGGEPRSEAAADQAPRASRNSRPLFT
ncbi:hypothetical protein NDU88_002439 [Pleurodeles waltl]|uniref:Uncharacterized protein n=1 Tax=Pleurodeles waltl TaxID=8319 RepID=A0AAV7TKP0_PLEWA|nr:hypothetical protein NDU88_002439 [Pleurodeles waltl]